MHLGPHLSLPMIEIVANTAQYGKGGITHTFLIKYENKEDHDYHSHKDPGHSLFAESRKGSGLEKIRVTDFVVGMY